MATRLIKLDLMWTFSLSDTKMESTIICTSLLPDLLMHKATFSDPIPSNQTTRFVNTICFLVFVVWDESNTPLDLRTERQ